MPLKYAIEKISCSRGSVSDYKSMCHKWQKVLSTLSFWFHGCSNTQVQAHPMLWNQTYMVHVTIRA